MKNLRLGDMLVEAGYITEEQLREALQAQSADRSKKIGEHLIDLGFIKEEEMLVVLSKKMDLPLISLETYEIDKEAVALIPEELSRKYNMIAIQSKDENGLIVVTNDPLNYYGIEDIRLVTGKHIKLFLAMEKDISNAIDYYYSELNSSTASEDINKNADLYAFEDEELFNVDDDDSPVVKLLNSILIKGYRDNVSDIHIEPFEDETLVRTRIDGMLLDSMKLQSSIHSPLVVRIKILSNLDISERRIPQDGHIITTINGITMNLRVSTIPTVGGSFL